MSNNQQPIINHQINLESRGHRAVAAAGPHACNSLPLTARHLSLTFKKYLNTLFF